MTKRITFCLAVSLTIFVGSLQRSLGAPFRLNQGTESPGGASFAVAIPGQTATLFPDGSLLQIGGMGAAGPLAQVLVRVPGSTQSIPLSGSLSFARAWHTATLLPDGTVFVFGGVDSAHNVIDSGEVFDPSKRTFTELPAVGLVSRAYHTATLLTDGTVLVAGGLSGDGATLRSAEIWNPQTQTSVAIPAVLGTARRNHTSTLLPDGRVLLWGGTDERDQPLQNGDLYDPETQSFTPVTELPAESQAGRETPRLVATLPSDGAQNVPLQGFVALRFSERLAVTTVSSTSATLVGPQGNVPVRVVPAESGMLAFVSYKGLLSGTNYTLSLGGLWTYPVAPAADSSQVHNQGVDAAA